MNATMIAEHLLDMPNPQKCDLRKISQWMVKAAGQRNQTIDGIQKAWMVLPIGQVPSLGVVR